jgi:hypothetical protein
MTIEEMRHRFQDEWILVEAPETNAALEVVAGQVLHHGKDRDEVYRQAVARWPGRSAILFTGQIPEGTAIVL